LQGSFDRCRRPCSTPFRHAVVGIRAFWQMPFTQESRVQDKPSLQPLRRKGRFPERLAATRQVGRHVGLASRSARVHPDQRGHPKKHRRSRRPRDRSWCASAGETAGKSGDKVSKVPASGAAVGGILAVHEIGSSGQRRSCSRRLGWCAVRGGYTPVRQCWSGAHKRLFLHDDVAEQVTSAGKNTDSRVARLHATLAGWAVGRRRQASGTDPRCTPGSQCSRC